jgi:F-type H+-transporting ATPase subunit epsilon
MASYQLSILTPQGEIFKDKVEFVSVQGQLGGFGVFAGHAPIISALDRGVLKIIAEGKDKFFAHATGVLEVKPDHDVLILVDEAVPAATPEEAKAKSATWPKVA